TDICRSSTPLSTNRFIFPTSQEAHVFALYFFFSSRRRHTRCLSDWSSDVCSSDLNKPGESDLCFPSRGIAKAHPGGTCLAITNRSEERRVGKECRYRWSREH